MSADFTRVMAELGANLRDHAEREWPGQPLHQGLFISRGGHAPGVVCALESAGEDDGHHYLCAHPDDECTCYHYGLQSS